MQNQTKNKFLTIFTIIICVFLTMGGIMAIRNYFTYQRKETIKLMHEHNVPFFEVNRIDGDNEDKILIPVNFPNFNPDKYQHLITIKHQAVLKRNGFDINTLYLKITTKYDTKDTFLQPEVYFNLEIKNNGVIYDDTKYLPMVLNNEDIGYIDIQIKLEQKQFIPQKHPRLNLIFDYELVDQNGNALSGGSQTIENKIIQNA
ncbi:hypothetical protein OC709_02440 ['Planchonia careya' phytoplasma]|nr:hypothetical protein ['Planchonia careya' phytoplasma]MDO8030351.1 hypothetical protein ['Planchonia careya' phytoplasma]